MSGDSEIPPTYYFSGITFNPSFYQSSSSDYLTLETAKSSFLTYPTAQGTETITTLTSTTINSSSEASDLSIVPSQTTGVLNIGTGARLLTGNGGGINIGTGSGAILNPITIGGASSAIAMKGTCTFDKQISASLGLKASGDISVTSLSGTITAPSSGFLIGPYKTASASASASITTAGVITGTSLVLGTGAITSCGAITASGTITANGGITLPSDDTLTVSGTISGTGNISTSGNISTTSSGTITSNGGLTIGGANGITLTTTSYTPTSTQLGGYGASANTSLQQYSNPTDVDVVSTGANLPIGTFILMWNCTFDTWTNPTSGYMNMSFVLSSGTTLIGMPTTLTLQVNGSATASTFVLSSVCKTTFAGAEVNMKARINIGTNAARLPVGKAIVSWIKIA